MMQVVTGGVGVVTRLQRERHARGWSQQQVIDRLKRLAYERGYGQRFDGLEVNTLSRYEHGRIRRPRAPLPELFAALYKVPVSELFPARRPAATWAPQQRSGLGVAGGELVEVVIPAVGRPVVRVGDRRIDASADRLLDATVAAVVASARALLAAVVDSASGERSRPPRTA